MGHYLKHVSPGIIGLESINSDAILDWGNPQKETYVIARRDVEEMRP